MKKKLHPFDLEQKKRTFHSASFDDRTGSFLFAKYFPKYQKRLFMANQNGAIKSKIKRTKVIKNFYTPFMLQNRSDWRVLFATKMKSVKTLIYSSESSKQFSEKIKLFSGLKFLNILMVFPPQGPRQPEDKVRELFLKKAFKNLGYLQNLEHLGLSSVSIRSKDYITRLNSHKKLLGSLNTLRMDFDRNDGTEAEITGLIEKNKNLWNNVTSIHLGLLDSPFRFKCLQRLGELCPKVSSLTFEFHPIEETSLQPRRLFEVKTNYLQTLKSFQNMRSLRVGVADIFTFIKDFALPLSIQALKLEFSESLSKEIMLKIDNNFVDSEEKLSKMFEENNILVKFYENFKRLEQLETLEIIFAIESHREAYKYQNYLFRALLKRIYSPLKSLIMLPNDRFERPNDIFERRDPSWPEFFESCGNFVSTLKTLRIGSLKVTYSDFDLFAYQNRFTNLSEIEIRVKLSRFQEPNADSIGSFQKNFISLGESITLITLKVFINFHAGNILSVLKQLNQLKKPNKLKIQLQLYFALPEKNEESGMSFADGINELKGGESCYAKLKGDSLLCVNVYLTSIELKTFFELYEGKFDKPVF